MYLKKRKIDIGNSSAQPGDGNTVVLSNNTDDNNEQIKSRGTNMQEQEQKQTYKVKVVYRKSRDHTESGVLGIYEENIEIDFSKVKTTKNLREILMGEESKRQNAYDESKFKWDFSWLLYNNTSRQFDENLQDIIEEQGSKQKFELIVYLKTKREVGNGERRIDNSDENGVFNEEDDIESNISNGKQEEDRKTEKDSGKIASDSMKEKSAKKIENHTNNAILCFALSAVGAGVVTYAIEHKFSKLAYVSLPICGKLLDPLIVGAMVACVTILACQKSGNNQQVKY